MEHEPVLVIDCLLKLFMPNLYSILLKKYTSVVVEHIIKLGTYNQINTIKKYIYDLDGTKIVQLALDKNATHIINLIYDNFYDIQIMMSEIFNQYNNELMNNK